MRNAVGLMGTALTDEQVGELARMASTVLLALMPTALGRRRCCARRDVPPDASLELRVVELPAGATPPTSSRARAARAVHDAVAASVPFVRFRVERVLDAGDGSNPEGRDRMLEQLRPVFATLPPGACARS